MYTHHHSNTQEQHTLSYSESVTNNQTSERRGKEREVTNLTAELSKRNVHEREKDVSWSMTMIVVVKKKEMM